MVSLALFRSRNFSRANLLTFFLYSAFGGFLFFLPLNLIQVQNYSATQAGAALLPPDLADVRALSLVRGFDQPVRTKNASHNRSIVRCAWLCSFASARNWRFLLDDILSIPRGFGFGHGDQCRPTDYDCNERGASK